MSDDRAIPGARSGNVSMVAADWRGLADFYTGVFGCEFQVWSR